jgi:hypothetical protein
MDVHYDVDSQTADPYSPGEGLYGQHGKGTIHIIWA